MEDARAFLEGRPMPDGGRPSPSQIISVSDVMELSDGRLGAIVVERSEGRLDAVYIMPGAQGDRWLIAELIDFAPAE